MLARDIISLSIAGGWRRRRAPRKSLSPSIRCTSTCLWRWTRCCNTHGPCNLGWPWHRVWATVELKSSWPWFPFKSLSPGAGAWLVLFLFVRVYTFKDEYNGEESITSVLSRDVTWLNGPTTANIRFCNSPRLVHLPPSAARKVDDFVSTLFAGDGIQGEQPCCVRDVRRLEFTSPTWPWGGL